MTTLLSVGYRTLKISAIGLGVDGVMRDKTADLFPDVLAFCYFAKQAGLALFAVTSCRADWINDWFVKHDLYCYFDLISTSAWDKGEQLERACNRLSLNPGTACYAGDMCQDMVQAKKVGMIPIGITRGHETKDFLEKSGARIVVNTLAELEKMLC